MSENSSDTPKPLYGVFFQYDGTLDEQEAKKEFYSYGKVHSVKQIQNRVYVNFFCKEAAEKCLQDGHEKYGEMSRGRFGSREKRESDNNSVSSKGCPRKSYTHKNNSSHYASPRDRDDLGEESETNILSCSSSSSRGVQHGEKKTSPKGLMSKLNHVKISPNKEENYLSIGNCDSLRSSPSQHSIIHSSNYKQSRGYPYDEDSQGDKPPELLSIHHPRSSSNKYYEESESPPPLVSTSANKAVSLISLSRESAASQKSQGDKPPGLLSVHHHPCSSTNKYYEESESPPPLVSASVNAAVSPNSLPRKFESSRRLETNDVHTHKFQNGLDVPKDIDIPPLIQTAVSTPAHRNSFQTCKDETRDPISSYSKQVLIANLPMDVTRNEIEKILYPLEPIYVTDLDVTNIRLKISFVQILFADEEEANQAARQFDGLTLRGHYLSVKKVIDLISIE